MNHFDFTGCRLAVVGDVMLDRYLSGSVERLSPEAPVPVLVRETERAVLVGRPTSALTWPRSGPRSS